MLCPRCGAPMVYRVESERYSNGVKRVGSYFKCNVCGYKLQDQLVKITNGNNGSVVLEIFNGRSN